MNAKKKYRLKNHIEKINFEINQKKIILFWLLKLFPPAPELNIKLDLRNNQLSGDPEKCERFQNEIKDFQENHFTKAIHNIHLTQKHQNVMKQKFSSKIFQKESILEAIQYISQNYEIPTLQDFGNQTISTRQYFYLISTQKKYQENYNIFQQTYIETEVQPPLDQQLQKRGKKYKRNEAKQIEQKQKKQKISENFYEQVFPNQSQEEEKERKGRRRTRVQRTERGKRMNGNEKYDKSESDEETRLRQTLISEDYPLAIFDQEHFKAWVKKKDKLDSYDFENVKTNTIFQLKYRPLKQKSQKDLILALESYIKFQKVLFPKEKLSEQAYHSLEDKYCKEAKNYLTCKLVSGYWNPSIAEHQLRRKILQKKIYKSRACPKQYKCIWIQGLRTVVEKTYLDIIQFIEDLPRENPHLQIIIQIESIKPYLFEDIVIDFVSQTVEKVFEKQKKIKLLQVNVPMRAICLNLEIDYSLYQNEEVCKNRIDRIQNQIKDRIIIEDLEAAYVTQQIEDQYIILPHYQKENSFVAILRSEELVKLSKAIHESLVRNSEITQYSFEFDKMFSVGVKREIEQINKKFSNKLKVKLQEKEEKIIVGFFGQWVNISQAIQKFNKLKKQIEEKFFADCVNYQEEEYSVLQKNFDRIREDIFKKYDMNISLSKNLTGGTIITFGKQRKINQFDMPFVMLIKKSNQLSSLPFGTSIIFTNSNDLKYFKQKYLLSFQILVQNSGPQQESVKKIDENRGFQFNYIRNKADLFFYLKGIQNSFPFTKQNKKKFVFIMPKNDKKLFVIRLLRFFKNTKSAKYIEVYLFQNSNDDLEKLIDLSNLQRNKKWYIQEKNQKIVYSDLANEKIRLAEQKGKNLVYLFNEELNLKNITHILNYSEKCMTHLVSKSKTPIVFLANGKAEFVIGNNKFTIDQKQVQKWMNKIKQYGNQIEISIAIYQIDLKSRIQTNLFSKFQRRLHCETSEQYLDFGNELLINYDYQTSGVKIYYQNHQVQRLKNIKSFLDDEIKKNQIKKCIKTEINLDEEEKVLHLENIACKHQIKLTVQKNNELIVRSYDIKNIENFQIFLPLLEKTMKQKIQYPSVWQPQKQDIQTFEVDSKSKEFEEVQSVFAHAKIKKLIRIQNKLVYKKYFEEKQCLKSLNEGKNVEEKKLFHGTSRTNPEIIYEDKQQCFNINYTSERNFLGKGTYFAVRSEYSHRYAYTTQNAGLLNILGSAPSHEMLYCTVITGDSQQILHVDETSRSMKDTEYKNKDKKVRYESSTTFTNGSTIYAVYKNRRAYPMYLIKY